MKHQKHFQLSNSQHIEVLLLQETHFPKQYNLTFIHATFPQFYLANATDKTKGVGIFFAKNTAFSPQEEIRDPEGRYILLAGSLKGATYIFVSYYAPNHRQAQFFQSLRNTLSLHFSSNIALDKMLDKSGNGHTLLLRPPKQSLKIAKLLHFQGLVDIWREFNLSTKDYTHYSDPHSTLARIDHIFTVGPTIPFFTKSIIRDSPLSDHSMVICVLMNPQGPEEPYRWHLNESILSNPVHCTMLDKDLREYFEVNDNGEVTPSTLSAAHKVVIRRKIIQLYTKLKHGRQAGVVNLERDFLTLSKNH